MTEYYLNSISGSDSNGGTGEDDAFASPSVALAALTGGDVLWVKGGGATYDNISLYGTVFSEEVTIRGYDTTPGDNCVGGTPPKSTYVGSGYRTYFENFYVERDGTSSPFTLALDTRNPGHYKNISINHTNTYSGGTRDSLFIGDGYRQLYGIRYYAQPGVEMNTSFNSSALLLSSGGHRTRVEGCVFDLTNFSFTSGVGSYINSNSTNYGSGYVGGTVFMGNPLETHTAYYYDYDANTSAQTFRDCIFYNLDVGIDITTSLADTASLVATYGIPVIIENCFFVNCGTGIKLQSGIDFPFVVKDCVFYNCTSYNIDGSINEHNSINATENPFDPVNKRLNDYGKSLLKLHYHTGTETVTSDSRREIYHIPIGTKFTTTDTGSLDLGTGGIGDTVNVSGKAFQLVQDNPRVWRWT